MNLSGNHETPQAEQELSDYWEEISGRLPSLVKSLPEVKLVRIDASEENVSIADILAALSRDGAVILENAQTASACDQVKKDIRPYIDGAEYGDGFLGKHTKRASAVVARSKTSWGFVQHPLLMQICEGKPILCEVRYH